MNKETNQSLDTSQPDTTADAQTPLTSAVTPRTRVGRKMRYSAALIKRLLGYISDVLNIKQSCAACGIGVTTLREWRADYPDLEERLEAAREQMRAKILAQIKAAGTGKNGDWKALAEHLRLSFPELRFGNSQQVNVAIQQNMAVSDPERANLIKQLEATRARALADKGASEPLQLEDTSSRREEALEVERRVKEGVVVEVYEPECLREQPPKTVVERADLLEERRQWREAARRAAARDEVDEILGD